MAVGRPIPWVERSQAIRSLRVLGPLDFTIRIHCVRDLPVREGMLWIKAATISQRGLLFFAIGFLSLGECMLSDRNVLEQ